MAQPHFTFPAEDDLDGPWPAFRRMLETHAELAPLAELITDYDAKVAFAFRHEEEEGWAKNGRTTLGMCCAAKVQGLLAPMFDQLLGDVLGYDPDWLILLNAEWWEQASEGQREILVFHEALHAGQARTGAGEPRWNQQTGQPILGILPHDVEEFDAVARRYGAWKPDLVRFRDALEEHRASGAVSQRKPAADVF